MSRKLLVFGFVLVLLMNLSFAETTCTTNNCEIKITLKIAFQGANASYISNAENEIESVWNGPTGSRKVHPRFYGTFPRVLGRYVREKRVLTLEQAVYKMTGMPARKLRLTDRGLLQKGYVADIVVFDETQITDTATFENPHQYPKGIHHVLVSGQRVVSNGEHTGRLPGKVLSRKRT